MFNLESLTVEHLEKYTWSFISEMYETPAETFLDYAIDDLKDGQSPRHLINALSNAKKALHMRMEEIAVGLGYTKTNKFLQMFEHLKNCGFLTPRTLATINKYRNKVEHDYFTPTLNDIETYIDVVLLFLAYTKRCMERHVIEIEVPSGVLDTSATFELNKIFCNWREEQMDLIFMSLDKNQHKKQSIKKGDPNYFPLVSMILNNYNNM